MGAFILDGGIYTEVHGACSDTSRKLERLAQSLLRNSVRSNGMSEQQYPECCEFIRSFMQSCHKVNWMDG